MARHQVFPEVWFMTYFLACSAWLGIWISGAGPEKMDLGGPRKVTAVVSRVEECYEIQVSLIPVRSFDPGMNRRLTREKARAYATMALLRHLSKEANVQAIIQGAEVIQAEEVDKRFVLTLRVPVKNVTVAKADPGNGAGKPSSTIIPHSILKAADDFKETLKGMALALAEDLPDLGNTPAVFYKAVGDAEELGVARLKMLCKEAKADRWLLFSERDDLLEAIEMEEKRFLERLRQRVELFEAKEIKERETPKR